MPHRPAMSNGTESNAAANGNSTVHRVYLILLSLIALAYCVWVLSLPLFPTQDGPMHLYFTHVLESVLRHPDGFYGHFYTIRHVLPPYALYYYLLMALGSFLPLIVADKVVICLYIVSFCFGFRYLARAIGPNADVMALLATVLLLNWPLGMGFVNFCLSTSFAFWALGLWCRAAGQPVAGVNLRRRIGFVVMCYVIMFTHPVPLLAVGGFCGLYLLLRLLRRSDAPPPAPFRVPPHWVADLVTLILGMGTLGYVALFTTGHVLRQVHLSHEGPLRHKLSVMKGYVLLHSLTAFAGGGLADIAYRGLFFALLFGSLYLALRQWRTRRTQSSGVQPQANTWTFVAVLILLGFPLIPEDLNNSAYFAARLVLFIWLAALLAAAGARLRNPRSGPALAAVAVFATVLILFMAHSRINPIADNIALAERMPPVPEHEVGLLLHAPAYQLPSTITYDPYFWSGVRMLRRTDSVMYNTPWLDLPIIPLGPGPTMPTYRLTPGDLEYPPGLRKTMDASPSVRDAVLSHVNLVIVSSGRRFPGRAPDALLPAPVPQAGTPDWQCTPDGNYSICESRPAAPKTATVQSLR